MGRPQQDAQNRRSKSKSFSSVDDQHLQHWNVQKNMKKWYNWVVVSNIFTSKIGEDSHFKDMFQVGLVQPPTSRQLLRFRSGTPSIRRGMTTFAGSQIRMTCIPDVKDRCQWSLWPLWPRGMEVDSQKWSGKMMALKAGRKNDASECARISPFHYFRIF